MNAVASAGASVTGVIATIIVFIIWGAIALSIYFIPTFIARKKQHIQKTSILLLNIFLGWTFIGWVVALIWANLKDKKQI